MLHSCYNNNKIRSNTFTEDVFDLSTVTKAFYMKNFCTLQKRETVAIHYKSIKELLIEMFKIKNDLTSKIVEDIFVE